MKSMSNVIDSVYFSFNFYSNFNNTYICKWKTEKENNIK